MEDFVTFEIAKKLKEKGFNEECLAYYTSEDTLYNNEIDLTDEKYLAFSEIDYKECLRSYNTTKKDWLSRNIVDTPTISQVLKWLRKEKKIHITVLVITESYKDADNNICEELSFWSFSVTNLIDGSTVYDDFEKIDCIPYLSYEQAALAGIEYVLDNLI